MIKISLILLPLEPSKKGALPNRREVIWKISWKY